MNVAVPTRHVLVVEDDTLLRNQLVHSLARSGYSVTAHGSVEPLADAALPDGPCVALLDMRLGQDSGLDALRLLRRRQPGLAVVFISGGSQPQEIVQAMKLGATDFLVKPFTLETLRAALERGLRCALQAGLMVDIPIDVPAPDPAAAPVTEVDIPLDIAPAAAPGQQGSDS